MEEDRVKILEITLNQKIKVLQDSQRDELDDHREAINENTNEIQANFEYLGELHAKIDKLQEKLESFQLFMAGGKQQSENLEFGNIQPLTDSEKKVFLVLYTQEKSINYSELGKRLNMAAQLVMQYVTSLIEKGVPIIKEYYQGSPRIRVHDTFKEKQAKENIIGLAEQSLVSFTST